MTDQKTQTAFPAAMRFAQILQVNELALFGGGSPGIDHLLGLSKDGIVYKLNKNTKIWEKFGEQYVG